MPDLLVELVRDGEVSEERLDVSARRLLREKFLLGLFEDPFVDVAAADAIVGKAEFRAAGVAAQRASVTVLTNAGVLPFAAGARIYAEGLTDEVVTQFGTPVATPAEADLAILRLQAPFEERASAFENFFHAGPLDFPEETLAHVREVAAQTPTVVNVFLDRPAILAPIVDAAAAVVANWGVSPAVLLEVLSGAAPARGRLPFDVPRSTEAVLASRPDVPFDTEDPLFRFGHGLSL